MSLRFLSIKDYLQRNFVLSKINLASQIWQHFIHSQDTDLRNLSQFVFYSNEQYQVSFRVPHISQLYFTSGKKKNDEPCSYFFITYCNKETNTISKLIPVEYYSHKTIKSVSHSSYVFHIYSFLPCI